MDLDDLRYFVSIADSGSFTRSAQENNIAQSALSRRIRDLEEELGVALFYRNGRGVVLTEQGEAFLLRVRGILAELDALRQDMRQLSGSIAGTVRLGVPPSVGLVLLRPLLAELRARHPGVRMRVLEGFSGHVADWLAAGKLDLAVLYRTRGSAPADAEHLLFEDLHLVSAPSARPLGGPEGVRLAEIGEEELALPGRPHGLRLLVEEAAARAGARLNVALELETLPTICDLVAAGTIRTILPLTAVREGLAAGRLLARPIVDPPVSRELVLAFAPHRAAAPATRAVVKLIRAEIARLIRSGVWVGRL